MPVFTLNVPLRLLSIVAAILRESDLPEDDGVTQVAIMREQGCSPGRFVAAHQCLDALKRQVEDAVRKPKARRAR